ncbi:MAG: FkbM family methyltransferase [Bacteroidetes bacterium]|nr:FkbM family methyltransferase [Bacteroidota bacterium]
MDFKRILRNLLNFLRFDLSLNLKYDRLTKTIISKVLTDGSNGIDIGCHKGEILDILLKQSPNGHHFGFEPIPDLFLFLSEKYGKLNKIYPYALSDHEGKSMFSFVRNASAYSGIRKRTYNISNPVIEEIEVDVKRLDDVIPVETPVSFIKIDVEGGEFDVLKGARGTISRNKPFILFEFGIGASDHYGTRPDDIFGLLVNDYGLKISLLDGWLKGHRPLLLNEFSEIYNSRKEYYFLAHP